MENTLNQNSLGSVVFKFVLPLSLEALIGYLITVVDMFMVGKLGETAIAAVGIANQYFYLLTFIFTSVCTGSIIFASQFWGKRDVKSLNMVLGISLVTNIIIVFTFSLVGIAFPKNIVGFFTDDPAVVALGSAYLKIKVINYMAAAISTCYISMMKSTGKAILPLLFSTVTLVVNIILNYVLIYGKFGFPAMGVSGAAIATCILRYAECIALLALIYVKRYPIAVGLKSLLCFDREFAAGFFKVSVPVIINEAVICLGMIAYNWIVAKLGVESIAAANICSSIETLFIIFFFGMANTCSILVGNHIGTNSMEKAYKCGRDFLGVSIAGSVLTGFVLILCTKGILSFYTLSSAAYNYALYLMIITGCVLWIKVCNIVLISGIIRSGGDTRFSMVLDLWTIWAVGVPLGLIGAFVFHLPVYWVMLLTVAVEITKMVSGLKRFLSRKWIVNIVSKPGCSVCDT